MQRRFAARAAAEGRRLEIDAAGAETVDGDAIRLEQAVGNLVDNALRHGSGTVRVEVRRDGEAVEVRVTDEGGGFASEFAPEAFERFTRSDAARTGGGAGLGLAIVQAIASAHGGDARIEERTGGGGCVVMRLPRAVG